MKRLLVLAIFGILGGCSSTVTPDMGSAKPVHYECEAGRNFEITFNNDDALLTLPKEEYVLKRAVSASGVKYVLNDGMPDVSSAIVFHGKGDEAMLELGRVVLKNCAVSE
ncbi:MliC family protein [Aliivibrio fischeri]|uniref:MliC family protein n=1 Tax=Aliivibrio fischeri TaxID=668 RepID=UPI0007C5B8FA|nr:MliC family protein [Aliivibrio fischeri]